MKYKRLIISIILVTIVSYLLISFNPITSNKVFAVRGAPGNLTRDIDGLDDNLYPGYKQLIKNLQASHHNYTFLLYYTGLDWGEVLVTEYQGHNGTPLNLFQIGAKYNGKWLCPICGNRVFDNGSWCCASLDALAYMIDPRNSINESDVFQFKDLEGADVSYDDIARAVSGYGAYLNNGEAIQAIVDASHEYNINGYFLVAKIVNEHGKNGSTLSNGNGYNGNYVGCYNYFNIGSYGNGSSTIINNGLAYAQSHGWTSRRASIFGGAKEVKNSYISRYSQNTLYYQKFNVSGKSALGSHQYQQNIMAAQSQGTSLRKYYSNLGANNHVFIIPVYENMPRTACARPNQSEPSTIFYEIANIQNINTLTVRASANGTAIGTLNNGERIKVLQRSAAPINGSYWDLIVSERTGTYGYAERIRGNQTFIFADGTTGGNAPPPGPIKPQDPPKPVKPPKNLETDVRVIFDYGPCIEILPDITCTDVRTKYKEVGEMTIVDSAGNQVTSDTLATGHKASIGGTTYKIIKRGDVNGDGSLNIMDAICMLNAVQSNTNLEAINKRAACVKGNSDFNITDVVYLLNCIKEEAFLSL